MDNFLDLNFDDWLKDLGDLGEVKDELGFNDKDILLIREESTFLINAIIATLERNHFRVKECDYKVKSIADLKDKVELIIVYLEDYSQAPRDVLVYLKDLAGSEGKHLLLVGRSAEFEMVYKVIPREIVADTMERPLDMTRFTEMVTNLTDEQFIEKRKKTILVVDDDPGYLRMIREWLSDDYHVGMANSGTQAITWLAGGHHADLILLDYEMPITDGAQVLEMLRSEMDFRKIPVMMLTGHNDKESIVKVLSLKPNGYLLKSMDRDALLKTLYQFFMGGVYSG